MEDSMILDLLFERSELAIGHLSDRFGKKITAIAMNILNSTQDAEECVNDTLLGVWDSIPPRRPEPLEPYVLTIGRNRAIRRYHRNHAQKRNSSYDVALTELEGVLRGARTVEKELEEKELAAALNRFLSTLDAGSRVLFMRRYWFGDSVEMLAGHFGLRPNTVAVKLLRTRRKLREFLQKEGIEL